MYGLWRGVCEIGMRQAISKILRDGYRDTITHPFTEQDTLQI